MIPVRKTSIIFLVALVITFVTEPFYRDYLFNRSLSEIQLMK